jgi:hypothetical protein
VDLFNQIRKKLVIFVHLMIGYQFGAKFKLVFCAKYDRGLDLGFWEILKPLKWTNITSFFLIWLKRSLVNS